MEQMRCGALAFTITVQEEPVFRASGWSSWLLLEASRGHWIHSRAGIGAVVLLAPRDERRQGTRTQLWTVPFTEVIAREDALGGSFSIYSSQ